MDYLFYLYLIQIFLCIYYLWVLASPLIADCPCDIKPTTEYRIDALVEAPSCCAPEETTTCCSESHSDPLRASSDQESTNVCCLSDSGCLDCSECSTAGVAVLVTNIAERVLPLRAEIVIGGVLVPLSNADRTSLFNQPLPKLNLSVHIVTTVLLC